MKEAAATNLPKSSFEVVVIGGSQGAIEALLQIVPHLPSDIPAAIFVVVHIPADADSYLPKVLEHAGVVPARHPDDGEEIRPGRIYVAPPNHHLTLQAGAVCVSKGPRENRHRPAIDPLFRTAARVFGPTTIALVLSGNLDDGSAGLLAVRERGGVAIVQDPSDARAGHMPQRALAYAGADYVLRAQEIGPKLFELIASRETAMGTPKGKVALTLRSDKTKKHSMKTRERGEPRSSPARNVMEFSGR